MTAATKEPLVYITYKPGNQVPCFQDFHAFTGAPSGIRFAVYQATPTSYRLVGPGHGGKPYGNGAIYVFMVERKIE